MTPFSTLTAIAAPLPMLNVDTDKIISSRFLKTTTREGLGRALFSSMRDHGDFILDKEPWSEAGILIALDNFGCGSSREHAVWALLDFGIRCVIAPSLADIFSNNCFKNGILPVTLSSDKVGALMSQAENPQTALITVSLEHQKITTKMARFEFHVDPARKRDLLDGVDEIGRSLGRQCEIDNYESNRPSWMPKVSQNAIDRCT